MTTEELVSVIVPVYNIEDYLPRCLSCIEMQTYRNLEIILVDDGSTDRSGQICDEYAAKDSRARVIHHPQNIGVWAARNTGQDAAHGEYLWFPDGDDYFHKDIVCQMLQAINRNGVQYDISLVDIKLTDSLDEDVAFFVKHAEIVELTREDLMSGFFKHNPRELVMWNKLFRRELIADIRTNNYRRIQDQDFCFRVYLRTIRAALIETEMYYWLQRPNSLTHTADNRDLYYQCRIQMMYNNYMCLPPDRQEYANHLLYVLYKTMIVFTDRVYGREDTSLVLMAHKQIFSNTWRAYLHCQEISFSERIARLFMVKHPSISHFLLNVRNKAFQKSHIWRHFS